MSKQQMKIAQEAIQAQDYERARTILAMIDHPKAREWEAKLDRLDPPAKARGKKTGRDKNARKSGGGSRTAVVIALVIVLVTILGTVGGLYLLRDQIMIPGLFGATPASQIAAATDDNAPPPGTPGAAATDESDGDDAASGSGPGTGDESGEDEGGATPAPAAQSALGDDPINATRTFVNALYSAETDEVELLCPENQVDFDANNILSSMGPSVPGITFDTSELDYTLVSQEGDVAVVSVSGTLSMIMEATEASAPTTLEALEFPLRRSEAGWRVCF